MGKYMKKGKITGDVAVMEIPQSTSSLGVRTRARTLALQPNPELSYLQLRSRRLEKLPPPPPSSNSTNQGIRHHTHNQDDGCIHNASRRSNSDTHRRLRVNSANSAGSVSTQKGGRFGHFSESEEFHDLGAAATVVEENNLDFDSRERSTRESTPCSLIRDAETIGTPGSTTRPTCSSTANRRPQNTHRAIPTNPEMEEFFAGFEHEQQQVFLEKYNYDIMNDMPLPGRFEWVRVDK